MPPPSLSITTNVTGAPDRRAEQTVGVVQEAQVAAQARRRDRPPRAGDAERRSRRSRRCRWHRGSRARAARRAAPCTTRARARAGSTRPRASAPSGSAAARSRATTPFERLPSASSSTRVDRGARACVPLASQASSQSRPACRPSTASTRARRATPRRRRRRARVAARRGSSQAPSGSTTTCATSGSSHAVATLLVSGAPTRTTRSGRCAPANASTRSSASYVEIACGPARSPEIGSASTGQPARGRERVPRSRGDVRAPARDEHAARVRAHERREARRPSRHRRRDAARSCSRSTVRPSAGRARRRAARRSARAARGTAGSGAPVRPAARAPRRPRGTRARARSRPRPAIVGGRAGIAEPPHRVAVQLRLVDRLTRAGVAQLGRPVGGAHDQRHARVRASITAGMEVRGRRARRAAARSPGGRVASADPERAERGRALVEHDVHADAGRRARARARAASNARPGRDDRVGARRARAHSSTSAAANAVVASRPVTRDPRAEWPRCRDRARARLHADRELVDGVLDVVPRAVRRRTRSTCPMREHVRDDRATRSATPAARRSTSATRWAAGCACGSRSTGPTSCAASCS